MSSKFIDAMLFRHACKSFDPNKKISDEDFETILEIGRLSPSSFGFEPWKFLVIQDSSLREKLKVFTWGAQGSLPTASHYLVILARKKPSMIYGSKHILKMMKEVHSLPEDVVKLRGGTYEKFQKEDQNLLESDRTMFDWASKQTYIALANMMTGAAYMGIDSCPVEGFLAKEAEEFLEKELKIDPKEYGISLMAAFGYRVNPQRVKTRQTKEEIVKWY